MSDESLELGKRWMALAQKAAGARLALDDMGAAMQRMEADHSDAARNLYLTKQGLLLSAVSNLGDIACSSLETALPVWNKICGIGKELANTINNAWHCPEGGVNTCVAAGLSWEKALAQAWTEKGHRVISGLEAAHGLSVGEFGWDQVVAVCDTSARLEKLQICPLVALAKNVDEARQLRAEKRRLETIFNNNFRMGYAALQRAKQQVQEIERQADEARAAYQAQREKDKERIKREEQEIAEAKRQYEEQEQASRRQAEMERQHAAVSATEKSSKSRATTPRSGEDSEGNPGSPLTDGMSGTGPKPSLPDRSHAAGMGSGGKSFDVTAWNYGDPVPGVERPPAFDKPKKKIPCRLKDTSCLDPLSAGGEPSGQQKGTTTQNPWSQEIEQKVKGGVLSSEQIRRDIEQKVRGGRSSDGRPQGSCDENLGCPDDESGDKGPGKELLAKLDSDLDRIQNSQPGTAGGVLPGETLEAGSSFDKTAMLRSFRSGLGAYNQGRERFSSSGGTGGGLSGGNCPNRVPVPQELRAIAQRRGVSVPPDPTIDEMIAQAGSAEAASSGLRQHIQELRQALAQWPRGSQEETRRQMELEVGYEQQLLQAVEACRSRSERRAPQVTAPKGTQSGQPRGAGPSAPRGDCRYQGDGPAGACR